MISPSLQELPDGGAIVAAAESGEDGRTSYLWIILFVNPGSRHEPGVHLPSRPEVECGGFIDRPDYRSSSAGKAAALGWLGFRCTVLPQAVQDVSEHRYPSVVGEWSQSID